MEQLCLYISSERNRVKDVEKLMIKANEGFGLNNEEYGKMMIAVTELVMNAIVHGNKEDAAKKVCVTVQYDSKQMKIVILDEGGGFAIKDLPNPTEIERLLESHGRGVFIAKAMVDKVEYKNSGFGNEFTLTVVKK